MEDKFHLGIKALITNNEDKILLLKVNKEMLKEHNGKPYWDMPGGRINKGCTVEETLKREIEEETGIKNVSNIKLVDMVLSNIRIPLDNEDVGLILSVYECDIDNDADIVLSDEHTEYAWFTPLEASKLLEIKYPKEFTYIVAEH
jgi:8-oxo-dGTP pyrophosphatase MutT (NUDIX family)